jgi:SAM-dependent methyltransferase
MSDATHVSRDQGSEKSEPSAPVELASGGKKQRLFVQYGCGLSAPDGWLNFDSSPRLRFERLPAIGTIAGVLGKRLFPPNVRYGDIVRGLPVPDNTADGVYASHVLEHLSREDVVMALTNTLRILKPGGVMRMIVPDLAWRAERYVREHRAGNVGAADTFIASCHVGGVRRPRGAMGLLRAAIGNSGHLWMYDRELMTQILTRVGFTEIRACTFNDAGEPMFERVEHPSRFTDDGEAEVALEAKKPMRS